MLRCRDVDKIIRGTVEEHFKISVTTELNIYVSNIYVSKISCDGYESAFSNGLTNK
jgi:hypothetical protein